MLLAAFTGGCLLPLSLLRSMDSLQPTSAVAMVCIVYTVAVVVCTPAPAEPSEAWRASADCLPTRATRSSEENDRRLPNYSLPENTIRVREWRMFECGVIGLGVLAAAMRVAKVLIVPRPRSPVLVCCEGSRLEELLPLGRAVQID